MSDQILRSKLIRLASEKPEMRQHLLPLLRQAAADVVIGEGPHGYIAFYKDRKVGVKAKSSYDAQMTAAKYFKARKSWDVTVMIAEEDGSPVTHSTSHLAYEITASTKKSSKSLEDQLHTFEMELSDFLNSPPKAKTLVDAVRQDIMPDNDQIQNSIVQNARKILKWKQNDKDMDELLKIWDEA